MCRREAGEREKRRARDDGKGKDRVLSRIYRLGEKSRVAEGHKLTRGIRGHAPPGNFLKLICAKIQSGAF